MTDLEITRLCAEAMGWKCWQSKHGYWNVTTPEGNERAVCTYWQKFDPHTGEKMKEPTMDDALIECGYAPLTNDEQAMALVKRFGLGISTTLVNPFLWRVDDVNERFFVESGDLNRAICECVAKMQANRGDK